MPQVNVNTPFGLSPIRRVDGAVWNDSATPYLIPAARTNALFVGDIVVKLPALADVQGTPACDLAAASSAITGVIIGFLGACPAGQGQSNASFFALSGTPGNVYRPAATSLDYYALVNDDPEAEFLVQENDNYLGAAGTPLPVAAVGKNANMLNAAGSVYTGLSGAMLDTSTVATTATLQLNIKGFLMPPAAVPGLQYGKAIVTINKHTEIPNQAGI